MIKQLIVAASAALLCAGAQAASYKDGTYTGEGTGNASKIQVEVVGGRWQDHFREGCQAWRNRNVAQCRSEEVVQGNHQEERYGRCRCCNGASNSSKGTSKL